MKTSRLNKIAILSVGLAILSTTTACTTTYVSVGAGYKVDEPNYMEYENHGKLAADFGSPVSARIEVYQQEGNVKYGVSHHSQWLDGAPFNNDPEYGKTEIFVDYIFEIGGK